MKYFKGIPKFVKIFWTRAVVNDDYKSKLDIQGGNVFFIEIRNEDIINFPILEGLGFIKIWDNKDYDFGYELFINREDTEIS